MNMTARVNVGVSRVAADILGRAGTGGVVCDGVGGAQPDRRATDNKMAVMREVAVIGNAFLGFYAISSLLVHPPHNVGLALTRGVRHGVCLRDSSKLRLSHRFHPADRSS